MRWGGWCVVHEKFAGRESGGEGGGGWGFRRRHSMSGQNGKRTGGGRSPRNADAYEAGVEDERRSSWWNSLNGCEKGLVLTQ